MALFHTPRRICSNLSIPRLASGIYNTSYLTNEYIMPKANGKFLSHRKQSITRTRLTVGEIYFETTLGWIIVGLSKGNLEKAILKPATGAVIVLQLYGIPACKIIHLTHEFEFPLQFKSRV